MRTVQTRPPHATRDAGPEESSTKVRVRVRLLCTAALLGAAHPALAQGAIVMRPAARVADGAPITLADVAALNGPDAAPLASVIVVSPEDRRAERPGDLSIDADRVRRAIDADAGPRAVNWGRLTLSGGACAILPAPAAPPPAAPAPPQAAPGPTVRTIVEQRLHQLLAAEPADLRLTFEDKDREILGSPTQGRTIDVRPAGASARMPLAVAVYDTATGRLLQSRTIRVGVEVRRDVAVARAPRQRGELIAEADIIAESRWVLPTDPCPPIDRVIGAAARSRITPGQTIAASDIEPPVIIRKGELVSVHTVNGLVIIRLTARALAPARDGEVVRLQSLTDESRTFYARMDGRGRAVAINHDAPPQETQR